MEALAVLRDGVDVLMRARDWAHASEDVLGVISRGIGCDLGVLWEVEIPSSSLQAASVWSSPGLDESSQNTFRAARFKRGQGLPGRTWETGAPMWLADIEAVPFVQDQVLARDLRSAWLVPLRRSDTIEGVAEFRSFAPRPSDPELLATLTALGQLLALYIAHDRVTAARQSLDPVSSEQAESARRVERALRQLYCAPFLGLFVGDTRGGIREANDKLLTMTGYSQQDLSDGSLHWDSFTTPPWHRPDQRFAGQLRERGVTEVCEKDLMRKDGTTTPILFACALLEGSQTDLVGVALDDTSHRHQERELAGLNTRLEQQITERTRSLRRSEARLAESESQLRALASRIETIQEQERGELAREIHDVLGQELTGLKMDVAWVERRLHSQEADTRETYERLHALLAQIDSLIVTVRRIATSLRPGVLDDLGLGAALEWYAKEFETRSGIRVELEMPGEELTLDGARSIALFRCFQELLTNVGRHAHATVIHARLAQERNRVLLEVRDNGRGIARQEITRANSLGLLGIRERVRAFDGELAISGAPQQGTRARVWIGLEGKPEGA